MPSEIDWARLAAYIEQLRQELHSRKNRATPLFKNEAYELRPPRKTGPKPKHQPLGTTLFDKTELVQ